MCQNITNITKIYIIEILCETVTATEDIFLLLSGKTETSRHTQKASAKIDR